MLFFFCFLTLTNQKMFKYNLETSFNEDIGKYSTFQLKEINTKCFSNHLHRSSMLQETFKHFNEKLRIIF